MIKLGWPPWPQFGSHMNVAVALFTSRMKKDNANGLADPENLPYFKGIYKIKLKKTRTLRFGTFLRVLLCG